MTTNGVATAAVLTGGALEAGLVVAGGYGAGLLANELLVNSWNSPDGMNASNALVGGVLSLGWPLAIVLGALIVKAAKRRLPFLASSLVLIVLVPLIIVCMVLVSNPAPGVRPSGIVFALLAVAVCAAAGALVGLGVDRLLNRGPRPVATVDSPTGTTL